jgi:outer membrane protein with beta-barrel domain
MHIKRIMTICTIVLFAGSARPATAQQRGTTAVDVSAGWTGFADDGVVSETPVGAAVRWYVSPRVGIGSEFTFISGESHSHRVLTANLTFDLLPPRSGQSRVTPFIVIGGGVFSTSESFAFTGERFSSSEGAFTVGGGVRAPINERVSIGADARIGWEPHIRLMAFASVRLGS